MVAWFSQKITEYERGLLQRSYPQFHTIEEAWLTFDRVEFDDRYAYRMRESQRDTKPIFVKRSRSASYLTEEKKLKMEEFSKFVEELKQKVNAEEYRKRIMEWEKEWKEKHNNSEEDKN